MSLFNVDWYGAYPIPIAMTVLKQSDFNGSGFISANNKSTN